LGARTELPNVLDITDDNLRAFEEYKTFTDAQLELVKKAVEAAREFHRKETEERIKDWDKLLEKYAEYETKINKIQNDAVQERLTFAQ
jgi:flagellar motility protein MotE (MotC chaperone)